MTAVHPQFFTAHRLDHHIRVTITPTELNSGDLSVRLRAAIRTFQADMRKYHRRRMPRSLRADVVRDVHGRITLTVTGSYFTQSWPEQPSNVQPDNSTEGMWG